MLTRGRVKSSIQTLIYASKNGDIDAVRSMIGEGLDVTTSDYEGNTALLFAAFAGHEGIARLLLDAGARVDAANSEPLTPLLAAAVAGHEGIVRLLLARRADVAARDAFNWTPLMRAHEAGHAGIVAMLREAGAAEPAEPPAPPADGAALDVRTPGFFPFNGQGGVFGFYSHGILPPPKLIRPPGSAFAADVVRSVASIAESRRARESAALQATAAERRRDESMSAAMSQIAGVPFCAPPASPPTQMNPFDIIGNVAPSDAQRIADRIGVGPIVDEPPYRRMPYASLYPPRGMGITPWVGAPGWGEPSGGAAGIGIDGLPFRSFHPLLMRRAPPPAVPPPPLIMPGGGPPPPYNPELWAHAALGAPVGGWGQGFMSAVGAGAGAAGGAYGGYGGGAGGDMHGGPGHYAFGMDGAGGGFFGGADFRDFFRGGGAGEGAMEGDEWDEEGGDEEDDGGGGGGVRGEVGAGAGAADGTDV
jgi:hypothetical protein